MINKETNGETSTEAESVPSCYRDTKLRDSLLSSQIDNMLEFLSKQNDVRIVNQQRSEPDLSHEEQLGMLRTLYESNPFNFLSRFGKYLEYEHLECFSNLKTADTELKLHLIALEKSMKSGSKKTQAKNRRYEALQKLVDTTDYFTEEEMQRRNPILYEQLIGRYHTKEEREAFLSLCQKSSSASTATPLTDMLMAHMNRIDGNVSERRHAQEYQMELEDIADEEYLERDEEDMEDDGDDYNYESKTQRKKSGEGQGEEEEEEREEIDEEEKDLLKQEFFTTMYRNFLEGKDEDFDYSTVDNNTEYDCGETLDQDEEEKYFDADDEEEEEDTDNKKIVTDSESTFVSKSESYSDSVVEPKNSECDNMNNQMDDNNMRPSSPELNPNGTHNEEDSEDELDIYMRSIEQQLHK